MGGSLPAGLLGLLWGVEGGPSSHKSWLHSCILAGLQLSHCVTIAWATPLLWVRSMCAWRRTLLHLYTLPGFGEALPERSNKDEKHHAYHLGSAQQLVVVCMASQPRGSMVWAAEAWPIPERHSTHCSVISLISTSPLVALCLIVRILSACFSPPSTRPPKSLLLLGLLSVAFSFFFVLFCFFWRLFQSSSHPLTHFPPGST